MADFKIEYIKLQQGAGANISLRLNKMLYTVYPITSMKSGEGHESPASSLVSEIWTNVTKMALRNYVKTVHIAFYTDDLKNSLEEAVKVSERNGVQYAELTFGVLFIDEKEDAFTTNDLSNWVKADKRPIGE